ncbi:MAG TPA: pyridoxal phosphate-dependent aminotransferase [Vicinamibacterales bacterium]|nr:pyridoxal phosphate-dependent aminotransferase [Vicinamibacterales bacterium]
MFSRRVPQDLGRNRLTQAIERMRAERRSFIDLTSTNPTRAGFAYPSDLLAPLAHPQALEYTASPFGMADARAAVSDDYARQCLDVPPERVVLTASTSEAYSLLFKLLADAGDEILIPRPSYPLFDHLSRLDVVHARPYDLDYHGVWSIDFASVERALTDRTRAVLIVSPNNPTGSFVSRAELDRLAALCADRDLALVVDEVFADYELSAGAASQAGRGPTVTRALTCSLGGLSKSVGLPQAKLGWMAVSGPSALVVAALARLEIICDTYLSVSTPVQVAARSLLREGAAVRREIGQRVVANYAALTRAVAAVPTCSVLRSDGGWSAVVRVPAVEHEDDLVVNLLTVDGVLTHPGYFFDFPYEAFLVISLLPPADSFADGINRILRHFACKVGTS